jgi:hypothetical protein
LAIARTTATFKAIRFTNATSLPSSAALTAEGGGGGVKDAGDSGDDGAGPSRGGVSVASVCSNATNDVISDEAGDDDDDDEDDGKCTAGGSSRKSDSGEARRVRKSAPPVPLQSAVTSPINSTAYVTDSVRRR